MYKYLKNKRLFGLLFSILIVSFLVAGLKVVQGNTVILNAKYIIMLFIGIIYFPIVKNSVYVLNNNTYRIIYTLVLTFIFLPLIGLVRYLEFQIFLNILLTGIYIIFLFITIKTVLINNFMKQLLSIVYYCIFVFLTVIYFLNDGQILNLSNIQSAFNLDDRIRQTFGMKHANTLGNIGFIYLVISLIKRQIMNVVKLRFKVIFLFMDFIVFMILLNSGSRTALTAIVILYVLFYINRLVFFLNPLLNKISVIMSILGTILIFLLFLYFSDYINLIELLESSNRYYLWLQTINLLNQNSNMAIGLGYVNISYFYEAFANSKNLITDNWFLYTYMTLGNISIFFVLVLLFFVFRGFYLLDNKYNNKIFSLFLALEVSCIYYSFFEVMYFTPSELFSLMHWVTILVFLNLNSKLDSKNYE